MTRHLRLLILVPTSLPRISGNAITGERWRKALTDKGVDVRVLATENMELPILVEHLETFKPDVLHAHHVSRAGALTLNPRITDRFRTLPLVVSPAGTDLFPREGHTPDWKNVVPRVCRRASAIVTQGEWTAEKLGELFPDVKSRIVHVPKSFSWFGEDRFDLKEKFGWRENEIVFFQPAGIRPVKRNLETLQTFKEVHAARARARLVFAGPSLDPGYAAQFQEELEQLRAFARWIPTIPYGSMHSAYESADVVMNASSSEGLSNALLEAIASGRAILASDIPGNRWPVASGDHVSPCGLLFNISDRRDFVEKAIKLIDDRELRNRLGQTGKERSASWPSPDEEARGLIHAYEQAIEKQRERLLQ